MDKSLDTKSAMPMFEHIVERYKYLRTLKSSNQYYLQIKKFVDMSVKFSYAIRSVYWIKNSKCFKTLWWMYKKRKINCLFDITKKGGN